MMPLKRLREHQAFIGRTDVENGHWEALYVQGMQECTNEIDRLRNALIRARHYAKQGKLDVVKEIVTSALFEPEETT